MSETLDIIVHKLNKFGRNISEKSNFYLKKTFFKSEKYAGKGVQHIEHEKLKWQLKKVYIELGQYIYNSNMKNNISDYSNDEKFILLLDKINRIKNIIKHNQST